MKRLFLALTIVAVANAQYGPLKPGPKRTTTPFPPQQPDYDPDINTVGPEENSAALSGSFSRPASPAGAVAYPDNPWLSNIIKQNPAPAPGQSRPSAPSYGAPAPAPAYQPAPAPAPAYQPAPAPVPAYQPAPTVACNAPGYVCTPKQQCQGGVTTSSGTGSSQCDANSQVCCQQQAPQPTYQQPAPQPTYQQQPQPYRPAPAPTQAPAPVYRPQPTYQQPAYQSNQPAPRPNQPTPIGGSIYDNQQPTYQQRPSPNYANNPVPSYVTEQPIQRYTGPLNTTPHPGCAAALKCVEEIYCTWDGIMADVPQALTREQVENKVPLSDCQNIETGIIGKCCRDPNYKDPWPAGMMMNSGPFDDGLYHPGVQHSGDVPQQQPQQPNYIQQQPNYIQQQPQQPNYIQQQPQQPNYIQQQPQQPNYIQQQPQPSRQPNYVQQPQQPSYTPQQQPQPSFNSRPSGIEREPCGPSYTCSPSNSCPSERQTQPGKACRNPNDDSTGVCCAPKQYPTKTNNQQYSPPKPQINPYGTPKPVQRPQVNPYSAPAPQPISKPQTNPYSAPQPAQRPPVTAYSAPAPQPKPKPLANPYSAPQPAPRPQVNPYIAPQPAPRPQVNSAPAPQPNIRPQPNPSQPAYSAPQPAPAPANKPLPFPTAPPRFAAPQPEQNGYGAPAPRPAIRPTPSPLPTPAPTKPEASNAIAPEYEAPVPSTTAPPPLINKSDLPEPGKECGVRREVPRPNGPAGLDTGFGEFPWQAQVIRAQDQSPLCSGVIVAENIIVTAAHCVDKIDAAALSIKAGDWILDSENPSEEPKPVQVKKVSAVAVHPQFEPITRVFDMAVLILDSSLTFDQHVDKLCLGKDAAPGQPPSGKNCVVTGWGKSQLKDNVGGSVMHSIPVGFMTNQQCQDAFRQDKVLGKHFRLHPSFTCALPSSPNHDLCEVDVGSPIACQKPDGNYELSGIYSWDVGCHPNTNVPAAMAKVDNEWVASIMNKPAEEVKKEAEQEKQRQEALGQSNPADLASRPGGNQGYRK